MEGANTAAFRLKALLLWLRAHKGSKEAALFLDRVGCGRALENETKPIALLLWVRALAEFERSAGEEAFQSLSGFMAHPNNLGAWSPLLSKADMPSQAFSLLSEMGEQQGFWRSIEAGRRRWRGQAVPNIKLDTEDLRRVQLALKAELEAIPLLFAASKAKVTLTSTPQEPLSFVAEWSDPQSTGRITGVALTALGSLITAFILYCLQFPATEVLKAVVAGITVALLITYFLSRESQQRRELKANQKRILALERASLLAKVQNHEASRPVGEPIVAGAYRVEQQLGTGAYASVWRARRLSDGVYVALKLLRSSVAHDPRATDRLRREAEALGLSWHPHVVEVLDHGLLASGVAYLVMEELKGESLRDRIISRGRLTSLDTYELARQAATGLNAAHRAGIIHRDIKPDHLFYHRCQGKEIVKLLDFGVAWVSWAEIRLTREGSNVGTRGYAAPEQLQGELATPSADLFSLGVTLYQALTGKAPPLTQATSSLPERHPEAAVLQGSNEQDSKDAMDFHLAASSPRLPLQAASDVREVSPAPQSARTLIRDFPTWMDFSSLDEGWSNLLRGLTHHDPKQRYVTVTEFIDALEVEANQENKVVIDEPQCSLF